MPGKVAKMKIQSGLKLAEDKIGQKDILQELVQYRRMHGPLLILTILLLAAGLVMMFSISLSSSLIRSAQDGAPTALYFFKRQLRFTALGVCAMLLIGRFVHVRKFNRRYMALLAYLATTGLLVLIKVKGRTIDGAQRWLRVFGLSLQPSEVAKIAAVFCLAFYFSEIRSLRSRDQIQAKGRWAKYGLFYHAFIDFTFPAMAMGLWLFLILLQPHLSGAIIFSLVVLACFLVAKIPLRSWLAGGMQCLAILLVLLLLVAIFFPMIKQQSLTEFIGQRFAHVSRRLATHDSPDEASADELYQVRQAKLAMGAGGLTGVGFGQGRQKFNYLPMSYNDYMFPALGEELGFLGTTMVLAGFLLFMWFGLSITIRANSLFALIIAWGYTMLITIQAILHMVVTLGLVPATGISLPFFSYGGSSNLFFLIAVGLILSVSRTAQRSPKELRTALGLNSERSFRQRSRTDRVSASAQQSSMKTQRSKKKSANKRSQGNSLGRLYRQFTAGKSKRNKQNTEPKQTQELEYPQLNPPPVEYRSNGETASPFSNRGFARSRNYLDAQKRRSS
ncbi:MAG: FtsW/RodA/SpoVE family cell cycle protein [Eubacteriales bacterium]|nr:FtsW/RodA/SpoVE family cell cycle protein [Eubacteriales bacterium]